MFITSKYHGYNRHGEQCAAGYFLILMQPEAPQAMNPSDRVRFTCDAPIRGIVRYVRMKQLGQFMMGFARIGKHSITLSGAYGHDGLPCTVPIEAYEEGIQLPEDLRKAWSNGGGWNSAGSEAPLMRAWATEISGK